MGLGKRQLPWDQDLDALAGVTPSIECASTRDPIEIAHFDLQRLHQPADIPPQATGPGHLDVAGHMLGMVLEDLAEHDGHLRLA